MLAKNLQESLKWLFVGKISDIMNFSAGNFAFNQKFKGNGEQPRCIPLYLNLERILYHFYTSGFI